MAPSHSPNCFVRLNPSPGITISTNKSKTVDSFSRKAQFIGAQPD